MRALERGVFVPKPVRRPSYLLLFIFVTLAVGVGVAGYRYYLALARAVEKSVGNELTAIADMEVRQVDSWRKERLGDAGAIFAAAPLIPAVRQVLSGKASPEAVRGVETWLDGLRRSYHYSNLLLFDSFGNLRIAVGVRLGAPKQHSEEARQLSRAPAPVLTDFHRDDGTGPVHLGLNIPIRVVSDPPVSGALLIGIDPEVFLYPTLRNWPTASRTAEAILVQRVGDYVMFLNELRHIPGRQLGKEPLAKSWLPAAQVALGRQGVVEGIDYRGVRVVAALRHIPDSPWSLVAKVDAGEVYAALRRDSWLVAFVVALLIFGSAALVGWFWRNQSAHFYQQKYETELERRALLGHYDYLTRYANEVILLIDENGLIVEANDRVVDRYGFSREELLRTSISKLRAPSALGDLERDWHSLESQEGAVFETLHQRRDGTVFPVEVSSRLIQIDGHKYRQSIIRDISERKQAETQIRSLNRLYALLSGCSHAMVHARSEAELFSQVCRTSVEIGGFGLAWVGMIDPDTGQVTPAASAGEAAQYLEEVFVSAHEGRWAQGPVGSAVHSGQPSISNHIESDPRMEPWRDAARRWNLRSIAALPLRRGGTIVGTLGLYSTQAGFFSEEQISLSVEVAATVSYAMDSLQQERQREQAEEATRAAHEAIQAVIQAAPVAIVALTPQGIVTTWNQAARKSFGWLPEEVLGLPAPFIPPGKEQESAELRRRVLSEESIQGMEVQRMRRDGTLIPMSLSAAPLHARDGQVTGMIAVLADLTEKKRAEIELRESRERLEMALDAANEGLWDWSPASDTAYLSPRYHTMLGYAPGELDPSSAGWFSLIHPEDRTRVERSVGDLLERQGGPYSVEFRMRCKAGNYAWILSQGKIVATGPDGKPLRLVGTHTDITERKRLEEEFRQAQKLESVGRLAGGVAHDFNNHLTVINGYAALLLRGLEHGNPMYEPLSEILGAGERAAALTRQLLAFSRKQVIAPEILDLNQVVSGVEKMLGRLMGESIELVTHFHPSLRSVVADAGQMHQVLMNLAVNARDAMPSGGKLVIETSNVDVDECYRAAHPEMRSGLYVLLSVSDSGVGMTEQVRQHIFEPFFTTKEEGAGTGLGLSTVYGIVRQSGGFIWVYSEPGKGTTFRIYLPQAEESPAPDHAASRENPPPASSAGSGSETILIVEDQDEVRNLAAGILREHGYNVLQTAGADGAQLLCEAEPGPIHLMITDLGMPGCDGLHLAKSMALVRPQMKVLFVSGHPPEVIAEGGILEPGVPYLPKPYTSEDLLQRVRALLDAARP